MKKPLSIYIHIPFCVSRCNYCSFVSSVINEGRCSLYFDALIKEINSFDFSPYFIYSVYFGGGTPSCVKPEYIGKILLILKGKADFINPEITIECNPESFCEYNATAYASSGINRISFGLQSAQGSELKAAGRAHNYETYLNALSCAKKYFNNISSDLILGLPGQTLKSFENSLNTVIGLGLSHISVYGLKVEENTKLFNDGYRPDEDLMADMYELGFDILESNGYHWYEVSNFAKDGLESRHNMVYWDRGEYKGFGAAAHSFVNNHRLENNPCIDDYIKGNFTADDSFIDPAGPEAAEETIMLSLRTGKGLDISGYNEKFGCDFLKDKKDKIKYLKDFICINDGRLSLTKKGLYVMNSVIVELI